MMPDLPATTVGLQCTIVDPYKVNYIKYNIQLK